MFLVLWSVLDFFGVFGVFGGFFTELLEFFQDSHKFSFIFIFFSFGTDKLLMGWENIFVFTNCMDGVLIYFVKS